jgi:pimeloyl-ACP methyl ester carboxylesterase
LSALGNGMFRLAPAFYYDMFVRSLPQSDRAIMREPRLKRNVIEDVQESLRQGGDGARSDLRIFSQAWNVDFDAILAPAVLWQGLADKIVPIEAALRLGELIPNCTSHRIPHAGHFWVYQNFEIIFRTLRERLSGR